MTDEVAPRHSRRPVYLGFLFEGGLILLAWLLGWLFKEPPLATFHWSAQGAVLGLAATVPMIAGFLLLLWWPLPAVKRIRRIFDEIAGDFFACYTVFDLAVLSLLAGVGEELLFRGVLQGALGHWLGAWAGLVAASVLFGLLHALTPRYALLATLAGAYLGLVWIWADNLLVVILAHALYDFFALFYLLRVATPRTGGATESATDAR
jgi:membrane protease YdiL (CAAX protease family)